MAQTTQSDPAKKPAGATPTAIQTGMQMVRVFGQRLGFGGQSAATGAAGTQKPRSRTLGAGSAGESERRRPSRPSSR